MYMLMKKIRRAVYLLSTSQTRAVARQDPKIDVAVALIGKGKMVEPWEAAAILAGQLSMKSTPSRLSPCWRPEEHIVHERESG